MVDSSQIPYAIAIDFDGILCQNAYPDIGDPNWDTIPSSPERTEQRRKADSLDLPGGAVTGKGRRRLRRLGPDV